MNIIQATLFILVSYISLVSTIRKCCDSQLALSIVLLIGIAFIAIIGNICQKRFPNHLQFIYPNLKLLLQFALKPQSSVSILTDHTPVQKRKVGVLREEMNQSRTRSQATNEKNLKEILQNQQISSPSQPKQIVRRRKKKLIFSFENILQQEEINLEDVKQNSHQNLDQEVYQNENLINISNFDETKDITAPQDNFDFSLEKESKQNNLQLGQDQINFDKQDSKLESQQTQIAQIIQSQNEEIRTLNQIKIKKEEESGRIGDLLEEH